MSSGLDFDGDEWDRQVLAEFGGPVLLQGIYGDLFILVNGVPYPCNLSDLDMSIGPQEFIASVKRIMTRHMEATA